MKILQQITLVLFLTLLLSSCAQDPWKADQIKAQAEADALAAQSQQEALKQEQIREQAADHHAIQMLNEQLEYERRVAVESEVRNAWSIFITVITLAGCAAFIYTAILGTRATVAAYETAAQGIAKAIAQAADIRSRLIYLDDGRQFPALMNAGMITDISTGAVTDSTTPTPANPQLATGAIANRHVGIVAKETRRSKKDAADSVPLSQQPPIIEAKFSDVREYFEIVTRARREEK